MRLLENYYQGYCYWAQMITFDCNGKCPYCIVKGRGPTHKYKHLSGQEIVKFWNSIERRNSPPFQRLSIIGGECTLHQDFIEIIHNLENYNVTITTNLATPFYSDENFWKVFKVNYPLRINTTFHPTSGLAPERYVELIRIMRSHDIHVDQIAMVQYPTIDIGTWKRRFKDLGVDIRIITFLGFWDEYRDEYAKDIRPETLYPNEDSDHKKIMSECGIDNIERYKIQCGMSEDIKRVWACNHGSLCLLVAPDGSVFECHYKLYYNIDPLGNILTSWEPANKLHDCHHFGKCNWCDIPRLRHTKLDWKNYKEIK